MRRAGFWLTLLLGAACLPASAGEQGKAVAGKLDFEALKPGELPEGWKVEATNPEGALAKWEVVAGERSGAGTNVLAVTAIPDASKGHYNLCWAPGVGMEDGTISVRVRADSGKIDQGGGLIWRAKDAANYYLARYNPIEKNFRLYCVKDGKRTQLADGGTVAIEPGQWFVMKVAFSGDRMEAWLDFRKLLEARDETFKGVGGVGLWTKADAASSFDDFDYQSGSGGTGSGGDDGAYRSADPRFAEADAVLNEARLATANAVAAEARIAKLEGVIERFPDYPHRAMAEYYLGLNCQVLERYDQAAKAFAAALRDKPELEFKTSIMSYLDTARRRRFASRASLGLIGVLALALVMALWRLSRADSADIRWGRTIAPFAGALVVWAALVLLVPMLLGPPAKGLEKFPTPTLVGFRLGQLGDGPLRTLGWYGVFAILAALPVVAAASRLAGAARRILLGALGVLVVAGSLMGLFTLRYCWGQSQYDAGSGRINFLVKDIATQADVPDEMLPLYDPEFRERIIQNRKKAGK